MRILAQPALTVLMMYSKSGSTHAPHCWIPLAPLVTEVSNVLVQLFWHNEYKESMEYVLFSELWSLSHSQQGQLNKHFALLSSASLLCLLGVSSEAFSQTQELHGEANEVYRIVHRHLPLVHEAVVELSRKKCSKTNRG